MSQTNYNLVGRVRVFQVVRSNVREREENNGLHLDAHVCSIRASLSTCVGHNFFNGISKGDVSRSVSTVFRNTCCSSLFFLLYLLFRDTSATASVLKRSKSAFSKSKAKRYTRIFSGYSLNSRHFVFLFVLFVCLFFFFFSLQFIFTTPFFQNRLLNSNEILTYRTQTSREPPSCVLRPYTPLLYYFIQLRILNWYCSIAEATSPICESESDFH